MAVAAMSIGAWATTLAAVLIAFTWAPVGETRDPNYALDLVVRDPARPTVLHQQRIVSLAWLEYLSSSSGGPLELHYTVISTPDSLTVKEANADGRYRVYRRAENVKRQLVAGVFEQVLRNYLYRLLKVGVDVRVYANSVDEIGVPVNGGRATLNRTMVLSFEDPPYGQSRVNRLVTNRRIPFVIWSGANMDRFRFRRDYNQTEDLIYRYFHNLGHALGFGHYVKSVSDGTFADTAPWRSVMYADYRDFRYSSATPVYRGVDAAVMPVVLRAYRRLLRENAERFVAGPLADTLVGMIYAAAREA